MNTEHVTEHTDGTVDVGKPIEQQLTEKAKSHIQQARELEQQADLSKLTVEDQMMYHYMQAVTTMLEQDHDIFLDSTL
jgi:hypothetical protein